MKSRLFGVTMLILFGFFALMVIAQPPDSITVTRNIPYTTPLADRSEERLLDVFAPEQADNLPVVVVLHGSGGSKNTNPFPELSQAIAERGAVVFNTTISRDFGVLLYNEDENGAGVRRYIEEATCALRFARATAEEYGGNGEKLIVIGQSGGGYVALWVSLVNDAIAQIWDEFSESRGGPSQQVGCLADNEVSAKPMAMIGYAGAFVFFEQDRYVEVDAELQQLINPRTYIGNHTDIVLRFIWGRNDTSKLPIGVERTEQLYEELANAGYNISWTMVEGGHSIPMGTLAESSIMAIIDEILQMMHT